jgi:hypothetical protein
MPVLRLVTYAQLVELTATSLSVSLRHVARRADGREILLLDDRGFTYGSSRGPAAPTRESVERDARVCVGPDEPTDGQTREHVDAAHRERIAGRLRAAGEQVDAAQVSRLAHDVVLDDALERALE